MYEETKTARVLRFLGWAVMVVGVVSGFFLANVPVEPGAMYTRFELALAFKYWIGSIVSGVLVLGFAEVVRLLDKINDKLDKLDRLDKR
ncbi:hypothetical protein [Tumebacillus flagellatus]|uniref:Uncharacterized protein n=1 Tax=Tumebacillus flagellatus TaxID=1157490 RepID=A0A074LII1_9BACL|nr:hypothetical protein [Tumebacillus flagellatus]KEO82016.1 hypothetical protein EL26_17760 [Tumebacillus flagellatus]